ncbi:metallophosphoesterase family protein [Marinilactibacillus kalidii]|uniref:metallophosphoesterase family protein n=1 Tax=Marinilactibacillus kalidii TaxID=2820274 RepID=UPI001ABDA0EE|nr:exonuclease SbcCD subunit D [Marinilactibacillus kalidii]
MITFIHAADLHLDSPFSGLKDIPNNIIEAIKTSTFQSLATIVQAAIHNQVDFVLFSGDIYDLEDRSVKAQVQFKKEMERLEQTNIPVYIIHGNHDFIGDESLHLALPNNVTVFRTTVETVTLQTKGGESVAISGFSYGKRWVNERMITHYPKRMKAVDFHIGMLHGFQEGLASEHAHYAPFTINELREKQYDYWALGHIHTRSQVAAHPPAYYPGNIQGRNKKETGEKGYLLVELVKNGGETVDFHSTSPIVWRKIHVDAKEAQDMNQIFNHVQTALPDLKASKINYLITLEIDVGEGLSDQLIKKLSQSQFIEAHQQTAQDRFIWITNHRITRMLEDEETFDLASLFPEAFQMVLNELVEETQFNELTNDFFDQSKFARLMTDRSLAYRDEMIEMALSELQQHASIKGANQHED